MGWRGGVYGGRMVPGDPELHRLADLLLLGLHLYLGLPLCPKIYSLEAEKLLWQLTESVVCWMAWTHL